MPLTFYIHCFLLLNIPVSSSAWAEERVAAQWEQRHQEFVEQVYSQLKAELHQEDIKQRHLKSQHHIPSAQELAHICSGDKLYEILELAPDPASVEVLLSSNIMKFQTFSIQKIRLHKECAFKTACNLLVSLVQSKLEGKCL